MSQLSRFLDSKCRQVLFPASLIAVSDFVRERLLALGAPPDKTIRNYLGVPVKRFQCQERTPPPDGEIRLLSVARLVECKGQEVLLHALSLLARQGEKARLALVGDGPTRPFLEALTRTLSLQDRVQFLGWQGPEEVAEGIRSADSFIMPSVRSPGGAEEDGPASLEPLPAAVVSSSRAIRGVSTSPDASWRDRKPGALYRRLCGPRAHFSG
jgi:glycosyltransferase involved in cell wall biosynthesis